MEDSFNPFRNTNEEVKVPQHIGGNIRPTVQTDIIDDYEPFDNQPAIIQMDTNNLNQPKTTAADLEKLQKDLEERSRRLAAEEERLNDPEAKKDYIKSINNFPPLPNCCPIKPCFYQAIDVEIPEEYRFIVRFTFILWMAYSITLFVNIFGAMAYMIAHKMNDDSGAMFGLSILYFLLFTPLSYLLWFRPLYKAFRNNSSFNFFFFFIIFGCQIIVLLIQVLGIKVLGSCGWIVSIMASNDSKGVMIFMILIAVAFTAEFCCCVFILIKVNRYFRSSGGSFQKAKEEMGKEAATSSTVRSTAFGVLRNN